MGAPSRPTEAITYEQARAYESSRVKWYNFYGHIINIKELADIFDIPHMTVVKRLESGWPLEAALLADKKQQWTINNVHFFQTQINTAEIQSRLDKHFAPKSKKTEKCNKGVICGGTF